MRRAMPSLPHTHHAQDQQGIYLYPEPLVREAKVSISGKEKGNTYLFILLSKFQVDS
jgi:hypothetical protein